VCSINHALGRRARLIDVQIARHDLGKVLERIEPVNKPRAA